MRTISSSLLLLLLLPLALTSPPLPPSTPNVFDIRNYGARGDGTTMNTQAFAKVTAATTSPSHIDKL